MSSILTKPNVTYGSLKCCVSHASPREYCGPSDSNHDSAKGYPPRPFGKLSHDKNVQPPWRLTRGNHSSRSALPQILPLTVDGVRAGTTPPVNLELKHEDDLVWGAYSSCCVTLNTRNVFIGPPKAPPLQTTNHAPCDSSSPLPLAPAPLTSDRQLVVRPGNTRGLSIRYTPGPGNMLARWDDTISPEVRWDQYYTTRSVARVLYNAFLQKFGAIRHLMVEPSAGTGAFFEIMPAGSLGFDVDPKCAGVWCADFLTVDITSELPIAVIGNPPFGRSASMAIKFFNRAARMANVIAFILPRSVRKAAIENRLNRNFHRVHDEVVPDGAFVFRSQPYTVSTVFQIWERQREQRVLTQVETTHPDFKFCTQEDADFAIQRVGARAGRVHHEFDRSEKAHYFVSGEVEHIMRQLDFDSVVHNTAGKPSLAKSEIVALYRSFVEPRGAAGQA